MQVAVQYRAKPTQVANFESDDEGDNTPTQLVPPTMEKPVETVKPAEPVKEETKPVEAAKPARILPAFVAEAAKPAETAEAAKPVELEVKAAPKKKKASKKAAVAEAAKPAEPVVQPAKVVEPAKVAETTKAAKNEGLKDVFNIMTVMFMNPLNQWGKLIVGKFVEEKLIANEEQALKILEQMLEVGKFSFKIPETIEKKKKAPADPKKKSDKVICNHLISVTEGKDGKKVEKRCQKPVMKGMTYCSIPTHQPEEVRKNVKMCTFMRALDDKTSVCCKNPAINSTAFCGIHKDGQK